MEHVAGSPSVLESNASTTSVDVSVEPKLKPGPSITKSSFRPRADKRQHAVTHNSVRKNLLLKALDKMIKKRNTASQWACS